MRGSVCSIDDSGATDEAGTSPLAEADKAAVRENLLEGIVRAPHAVQVQLAECAKYVVYADYPERWPSLLPAIGAHLATQVGGDKWSPRRITQMKTFACWRGIAGRLP